VHAGDILCGKITPKGESPMTPEEKLCAPSSARRPRTCATRRLRVPPGVTGTIVEVRVFNRHGVDKDERAQAIEREEIERLAKDRDDEQAILDRNTYARLATSSSARRGRRPEGLQEGHGADPRGPGEYPRSQWWAFAVIDDKAMTEIEAMQKQYDESKKAARAALPRQGREAAARATSFRPAS
jgi:DNA-directed RNA polymerase subunit beta